MPFNGIVVNIPQCGILIKGLLENRIMSIEYVQKGNRIGEVVLPLWLMPGPKGQ